MEKATETATYTAKTTTTPAATADGPALPGPEGPGWLRRLWAQDAFVYSLRVFIALSGAMAVCWWRDQVALVTPLFLGIIASALAETDDSWRGRLRAVLVMLGCFALAAFSVQILLPRPAWFVAGLALSTFGFTMLGAIGERYRAIASATVILALYAAISASGASSHAPVGGAAGAWQVPLLLLAGAAWYALLSLLWCALFPHQPVRQNLAQLYDQLGAYLRLKASLFEPVRGVDVERRRLALAQTNGRVVAALNATKESIFSRWGGGTQALPTGRMLRHLNLYFLAQDIHERASSSHHHYNEWADVLFHSDVLYRCQRVLRLQGVECARIAQALQMHQPFVRDGSVARAMDDLRGAIAYLEAQRRAEWQRPLRSLRALARNLATLDGQLDAAAHPEGGERGGDSSLLDRSPRSLADAWERVRAQLRPGAPLFRHAVRLSLALAAGHGAMQLIDPVHGYWIPLATLFVCQPTYGATLARVAQRIAGTAVGLVVGWALLRLFPSLPLQALFAVAAGVLFFVTRTTRYLTATAAITLLVLMCFNQATGEAHALILPRLLDTLIGSAIAAVAMFWVLPDWQGRRLAAVAAQALAAHAQYLREILSQYATGKADDLDYRLARRNAHNADAALSTTLSHLLQEPRHVRSHSLAGMRMLVASHTLLNYLSALGAHRAGPAGPAADLAQEAGAYAAGRLEAVAAALRARGHGVLTGDAGRAEGWAVALEQAADAMGPGGEGDGAEGGGAARAETVRTLQTQVGLVCRQVGVIEGVVGEWGVRVG
ncbi:YccS family putative transporter [Acidovorax sp. GBBC 3334]|uniref:YccS family putative transporter n=1 Tax=Acidovorax sp. GBBC 3334 TaxID=2940496 RepID=UPI0023045F45|nr:YccS family putative transporter [Acidovorax sp. GBBC 3334]MDA8454669.1 YccS family putative transporter [Acidovorax sp. GBBC 3334]